MSDKRYLEYVHVPRPCPISWESMSGTDKVRVCAECHHSVHNLSALSNSEAASLLRRGDERLCITFSRGPDGKIITADRLPKYSPSKRPFTNLSIAALAAFIGISQPPAALGARAPAVQIDGGPQTTAARKQVGKKPEGRLSGTIYDVTQNILADAEIKASNNVTGEEFTARSGDDGAYRLPLPKGEYTVSVTHQYYMPYIVTGVKVRSGHGLKLNAMLGPPIIGEYVPVRYEEPRSPISRILTAPFKALKRLFS